MVGILDWSIGFLGRLLTTLMSFEIVPGVNLLFFSVACSLIVIIIAVFLPRP